MKNKKKLKIFLLIMVLLIIVTGVTWALINVTSSIDVATGTYDVIIEGNTNVEGANLVPIVITDDVISYDNLNSYNNSIFRSSFTVKGAKNNPDDRPIIYDVALIDTDGIDNNLLNDYMKWELIKNKEIINHGDLSDLIKGERYLLTTIQQDLPRYEDEADSYELVMWISNNFSEDFDQTAMMNKRLKSSIDIELYTKSKMGIYDGYDKIINNIEDLVQLSNDVNGGYSYVGEKIALGKDLDFKDPGSYVDANKIVDKDINGNGELESLMTELTTGTGFKPIGMDNFKFRGTFDGKNHKINNLFIHNEDYNKTGFFRVVQDSTIRNLTLAGTVETSINADTGAFVGYSFGNTNFENCHNYVNVSSDVGIYSLGGIVGVDWGTMSIKGCTNNGTIKNGNNAGGLIGYVGDNATLNIENSHNSGDVTNFKGLYMGGLVGMDYGSGDTSITNIINSYNEGALTLNADTSSFPNVGGLMVRANGILNINNSYNKGNIDVNRVNNDDTIGVVIGGLIGKANRQIIINNSSNEGTINNANTNNVNLELGGLVGNVSATNTSANKIVNSYNNGTVNGGNKSGGIAGLVDNASVLLIDRCYNLGQVKNTSDNKIANIFASGIIGYQGGTSDTVIMNSYNAGDIISRNNGGTTNNWSFGLILNEQNSKLQILNSYNIGNLDSTINAYGISRKWGGANSYQTVNNVYNYGTLTGTNKKEIVSTGGQTQNIVVNNAYYVDRGISASEIEINATALTEDQLLNKTKYNDKLLVDILNENIKTIDLSSVNPLFKNLTFCNWKAGESLYPVLDCK